MLLRLTTEYAEIFTKCPVHVRDCQWCLFLLNPESWYYCKKQIIKFYEPCGGSVLLYLLPNLFILNFRKHWL